MQPQTPTIPQSPHFHLERLAEGVYAALAREGGAAYSNAGIVDFGGRTLVFDAFDSIAAARDLNAAAIALTGRAPDWLIISHAHGDHWTGSQAFARETLVIATRQARLGMLPTLAETTNLKDNPGRLIEMIKTTEAQIKAESDATRRSMLEITLARRKNSLAELPCLQMRLPDQTFEGSLTFYGHQRRAELIAPGAGHTSGDCYLHLADEGIVFLGDLGFFQCPPFMPNSNPAAWHTRLQALEAMDLQILIPGHGPLGTRADLVLQRQYMVELEGSVSRSIKAGLGLDEIQKQPLPPAFDIWEKFALRNQANQKYLYEQLSAVRTTDLNT